jgi:hypothetical protein
VLNADADVQPPGALTPVFFGCYDWHSSVHGHWLLVRLVRPHPEAAFAAPAREALAASFTATRVAQELAYLTDRKDPKLAHIDGLNLSRAWMLQRIAAGLPTADPRRAALASATRHTDAALPAVTGEHYEGGHWLGSFAVYLLGGSGRPAG